MSKTTKKEEAISYIPFFKGTEETKTEVLNAMQDILDHLGSIKDLPTKVIKARLSLTNHHLLLRDAKVIDPHEAHPKVVSMKYGERIHFVETTAFVEMLVSKEDAPSLGQQVRASIKSLVQDGNPRDHDQFPHTMQMLFMLEEMANLTVQESEIVPEIENDETGNE